MMWRGPTLVEAEIQHFESQAVRVERGELSAEAFKPLRLQYGVYSTRGSARQMLRIRVPLGRITPSQLDAVAQVCDQWAQPRLAHLTTRQDLQLYGLEPSRVPAVLRALAASGLTTREASGNVIRNITCCPWAGVSPEEAFDITPYAEAVTDYFLRNPLSQLLPRKVKMAFEGCTTDHVRTAIHDIGIVAAQEDGQSGVRIYLGGGLGPTPRAGQLLEPWTAPELLLPTIEAVLRVFDRLGERKDRARARLKFLIERLGWPAFREQTLNMRQAVWATQSGYALGALSRRPTLFVQPPAGPAEASGELPAGLLRWQATNVVTQKQAGFVSVLIRVPSGDLMPFQWRGVAHLARRHAGGVRLTTTQNLLLRFVAATAVPTVYDTLSALGLAGSGAGRLVDVTRCPGADSCLSAITRPRGLAEAIEGLCRDGLSRLADLPLSIKISGCPNSCGQHHIADIGCFGVPVKIAGQPVPCYQLLVGGSTQEGRAVFGQRLARVPARRAPEAIRRLAAFYDHDRQAGESFGHLVGRVGLEALRRLLSDLADDDPSAAAEPSLRVDLGATEPFQLAVGQGECGASSRE